jgi:hypothetical protein
VTVIVNHWSAGAGGSGGAGIMPQFAAGIVNTGLVVVCEKVVLIP